MAIFAEPWRDKLPKEVVERVDKHRAKKQPTVIMEMTITPNSQTITVPIPQQALYKKIKVTITTEE